MSSSKSLPSDDWLMLGLSKWMCWLDVSMGAGERPRRGELSCWSAMMAKLLKVIVLSCSR
jgi:hypothetical protein